MPDLKMESKVTNRAYSAERLFVCQHDTLARHPPIGQGAKRGTWLWVKPMGSHVGVGEFTTHFNTYFSGWIGTFTGGTGFGF